jgi:SAM-dependent methyltransferase
MRQLRQLRQLLTRPGMDPGFFIKPGYISRSAVEYFDDVVPDQSSITYQPDVYPLLGHLAERFGCDTVIDIGSGTAAKLMALAPRFRTIGVDFGANIEFCRANYTSGEWVTHDLESGDPLPIPVDVLRRSAIVSSDVVEHLLDPGPYLAELRRLLEHAPVAVLSTPERDLVRGHDDLGPPRNRHHVREWNLPEFERLLDAARLPLAFSGLTMNQDQALEKKTILAVLENRRSSTWHRPPESFDVLAIVTAYNEADVIRQCLQHLRSQQCRVHVVENWSTDATPDIVEELVGTDPGITFERFPNDGPTGSYDWRNLLKRVDDIAARSGADWCIHHDADEIRRGPWPGVSLREALHHVQTAGFNAVDHTVVNFWPGDDSFTGDAELEAHFRFFEFGRNPGHQRQIKAWRNRGESVRLSESGGHAAQFEGRRVYPYNFELKHYPIRSTHQGLRKVLQDRKPRWNTEERQMGWHSHYDHVGESGAGLLRDPATLREYTWDFHMRYLAERLGRVGAQR